MVYTARFNILYCESGVFGPCFDQPSLSNKRLIRLSHGDKAHDVIANRFLSNLGSLAAHTKDLTIQKNCFDGLTWQARLQSFQIFIEAMGKKCGGDANVKYAWCAATGDEISKIVEHGFGYCGLPKNSGLYGHGVYLSPADSPMESVKNVMVDNSGMRYLVLCRVILGKEELVQPGSTQCHPSSDEFDSGVDDLSTPKKYIVWTTHLNTHILPEYVEFQSSLVLERAAWDARQVEDADVTMDIVSSSYICTNQVFTSNCHELDLQVL